MLSNHLQNGMETAKLIWSRLPNSDVETDGATVDELGQLKNNDGSSVESLDYEVIENCAYRQEQVRIPSFHTSLCDISSIVFRIVVVLLGTCSILVD